MTTRFNVAISTGDEMRVSHVLGHHLIRVTGDETAGTMGVWEELSAPGEGPPMHVHHREEEMFFVLDGQFRFWCGEDLFEGGPGTAVALPRDVPHTWSNIGEGPGRMLVTVTPGGFERFFLDLQELADANPAAVADLAGRYGLEFCPSKTGKKGAA